MNETISRIQQYVRAANYLSAIQIYLQDNFLLDRPLTQEDIKSRLLGHWGTCPGINFVYANMNELITQTNTPMMLVVGPGHGFPAVQANLFLEGTLSHYYPEVTQDYNGIAHMARQFSWPYGFPSHSSPATPGVILEGGELGYSLSTSFGAALDNPDLIVTCLVGDGEAETGPTATAWHINKLLDPATNGAVLPIVHLNGYKISGPTIYGRMSTDELMSLFTGYGYHPHIVEGENIYEQMHEVMHNAHRTIRSIQEEARNGSLGGPPRWPMIILRTQKGWTGIKELKGKKIEGNHYSHQVVVTNAKEDQEERQALEEWLRSYNFSELFNTENGFNDHIKALVPEKDLRLGESKHAHGGEAVYKPLDLPDPRQYAEDASIPGTIGSSSMRRVGLFLNEVFKRNGEQANFRLFSPDETYSNKLDAVFETTERSWVWPIESWDQDLGPSGRVMEMLSEHSLQGLLQGYILTGRHGVFASYEAFVQIVSSMADQYAKFLRVARLTDWRGDIASLNYILTSSGWRQEHNGFSHQNPGFINDLLLRQGCFVNAFFPPDGNSALVVMKHCLASKNEINIIVAGKTLEPRWLTVEQAEKAMERGLMTWDFASDEDPHVVIASIGDYMTKEALAGLTIAKQEIEDIRIRFVNIISLSALGMGHEECRVPMHDFEDFFTHDKPVIFNFHGYPQTLKQILFDYHGSTERFTIHGYEENGSTTTPFDMHVRNRTSRYHIAMEVFIRAAQQGVIGADQKDELVAKYETKLQEHKQYIIEHGVDPDDIEQWQWQA